MPSSPLFVLPASSAPHGSTPCPSTVGGARETRPRPFSSPPLLLLSLHFHLFFATASEAAVDYDIDTVQTRPPPTAMATICSHFSDFIAACCTNPSHVPTTSPSFAIHRVTATVLPPASIFDLRWLHNSGAAEVHIHTPHRCEAPPSATSLPPSTSSLPPPRPSRPLSTAVVMPVQWYMDQRQHLGDYLASMMGLRRICDVLDDPQSVGCHGRSQSRSPERRRSMSSMTCWMAGVSEEAPRLPLPTEDEDVEEATKDGDLEVV